MPGFDLEPLQPAMENLMSQNRLVLLRSLKIVAAAAAMLAISSCGGGAGDAAETGATQFATQMRALEVRPSAQPATLTTFADVTADMVLDWAQFKFPELFPKAGVVRIPSVVVDGVTYNARVYSGPWGVRYLGITPDGRVFGLGDFTNNALQQFETIAVWSAQVLADQCSVNPGSCGGTNQPAGPFNGCSLPASQVLVTGNRLIATYAQSGSTTGQYRIDALVQGPGSFEGQSAIRTLTKIEFLNSAAGTSGLGSSETTLYEQDAGGGFTRLLGFEGTTSVGGGVTLPGIGGGSIVNRTVYSPASVNVELSIQPGQSITKAETSTSSSVVGGIVMPGIPTTTSEVHTFERRESIAVRGRSYNTCRYTLTDPASVGTITTNWVIDGLGITVRTEVVSTVLGQTRTEVTELVSGSFNGAPL